MEWVAIIHALPLTLGPKLCKHTAFMLRIILIRVRSIAIEYVYAGTTETFYTSKSPIVTH
jgi:hypothetical protein